MHLESQQLPPAATTSGNYRWAIVGMLWFICFFNYADRQAISSVLPLLEKEFSFTKEQQGIIGGAFMWIYGLSAPLAGLVGDRSSRKKVILAGLYVWSAVTGMTALCTKLWHFVLVRGAEGLGETFYFPASMSLVSDYHGHNTRSRAMSLHQTSVYAGIIGGGVVTGWLAERFGWRFPFLFFGLGGIALGIVLTRFLREPPRNAAERSVRQLHAREESTLPWTTFILATLTNPASFCLLLAFVGANTVAGVLYLWLTTYVKDKFGLELWPAAVVGTVPIQVGAMIGSITGGMLADTFRRHWLGGRAGVQAIGIVGGVPMLLLCTIPTQLNVVIVGLSLLGFFKGMYDSNIWPAIYEVVHPSRRSSAVGVANMIGWGGAGFGAALLGRVVDKGTAMSDAIGYTAIVYGFVAVLLVATALVFTPRHIRTEERRSADIANA